MFYSCCSGNFLCACKRHRTAIWWLWEIQGSIVHWVQWHIWFFSKSLLTFDLFGLFWWRNFKNTLLAVFLKGMGSEANLYDPCVIKSGQQRRDEQYRPLFLSQIFRFFDFCESSCFDVRIDSSWRVLLQLCQNPIYLCAQSREFLSVYLLHN